MTEAWHPGHLVNPVTGEIVGHDLRGRMQDPERVRSGKLAALATDLMNCWNAGKRDPSLMAVCGHDTSTGYEFVIEWEGVTYTVTVTRDHDE